MALTAHASLGPFYCCPVAEVPYIRVLSRNRLKGEDRQVGVHQRVENRRDRL